METVSSFQSANINAKWLANIYDNLKNLEALERTARHGAPTLIEYLQIPIEMQGIILGDTQYQNLKYIITELDLLLTDLTPILDSKTLELYRDNLEQLKEALTDKDLFVTVKHSLNGTQVLATTVKPYFHETLEAASRLKRKVIADIAGILYMKPSPENTNPFQ